jgi:putative membrane protein
MGTAGPNLVINSHLRFIYFLQTFYTKAIYLEHTTVEKAVEVEKRSKMSTTGRRIITIIGGLIVAGGLVLAGFWLGRSNVLAANFYPDRVRFFPMLGWGGILSGVVSIAMWALIIGLCVWVVSGLFGRASRANSMPTVTPDSALDILQKRYARGEITKTEFDDMRRNLSAS